MLKFLISYSTECPECGKKTLFAQREVIIPSGNLTEGLRIRQLCRCQITIKHFINFEWSNTEEIKN